MLNDRQVQSTIGDHSYVTMYVGNKCVNESLSLSLQEIRRGKVFTHLPIKLKAVYLSMIIQIIIQVNAH